jgi:hypothetical protein
MLCHQSRELMVMPLIFLCQTPDFGSVRASADGQLS